jgi:RNA polymerase sigma-70 factor (ECF subfamily)
MRSPDEPTAERDFERWRQHYDGDALGRVFDRLAPELLIVAAHVAGRAVAEDLVQTTFLTAITESARWDATRRLMPWLVGILVNLSLREQEKARRSPDPARVRSPGPAADPHAEAERHEVAEAIAGALQGMPRHYRQVLTLRLVHGLEPTAIAHALGSPPATVKSRLQRGLARLRKALPGGLQVPSLLVWQAPSLLAVRECVLAHGQAHAAAAATATIPSPAAGTAVAGLTHP